MTTVSTQISKYIGAATKIADIWGNLIINVKDTAYGAKGDSTTDDTAAIQAAINHANTIGKKEIYFPVGTYKYTTLTGADGLTFIGDGVTLNGTTTLTLTSVAALKADTAQRGYNVKNFGAKGNAHYYNGSDGKYYQDAAFTQLADDDTAAFNLATLAASAHTEGNGTPLKRVILVPDGDYLIEGTVYVRKGQHLKGIGLGPSRIVIPVTDRTDPTFAMGYAIIGGVETADSGGLPPTISDLCTEGGSTASAVFDTGGTAGVSLYNLFITTAGIGIRVEAGDLQAYNIVFDNCTVGAEIAESSRNVFTACSFFLNNFAINITGQTYDTIVSNCNFAYSKFSDIQIGDPGDDTVKNLVIKDNNFTANGQYTSYLGGILFNGTVNSDVKIQDCSFNNQYGYALTWLGTAAGNVVLVEGCTFDGDKTHSLYTQGTTSKGVVVGNNDLTIKNSRFVNLRGDKAILVDGTSGSLVVEDCTWKDNGAISYLIHMTSAGTQVTANNNTGDDTIPLINCFAAAEVKLGKNYKWLGAIATGSSKKYVLVPTFQGFNGLVRVSGCPNAAGSVNYRKTSFFSVYRQTEFISSAIQDNVVSVTLAQAAAGTNIALDITVALDSIAGSDTDDFVRNRYIAISVPDTWSDLEFIVE